MLLALRPRAPSFRAVSGVVALLALMMAVRGDTPRPARAATATLTRAGDLLTLANGAATIRYDLGTGLVELDWGAAGVIRRGYAAAQLADDGVARPLRSTELVRGSLDQQAGCGRVGSRATPYRDR